MYEKLYVFRIIWFDMSVVSVALQLYYCKSSQPYVRARSLGKQATIHQLTTMLSTSEKVLFPGHNHLLTTSADDRSLTGAWAIIKVSGHRHQWLAGGYDLE